MLGYPLGTNLYSILRGKLPEVNGAGTVIHFNFSNVVISMRSRKVDSSAAMALAIHSATLI